MKVSGRWRESRCFIRLYIPLRIWLVTSTGFPGEPDRRRNEEESKRRKKWEKCRGVSEKKLKRVKGRKVRARPEQDTVTVQKCCTIPFVPYHPPLSSQILYRKMSLSSWNTSQNEEQMCILIGWYCCQLQITSISSQHIFINCDISLLSTILPVASL